MVRRDGSAPLSRCPIIGDFFFSAFSYFLFFVLLVLWFTYSDSFSVDEPLVEIGCTIPSHQVKCGMLYKSMGVEVIKCNCHRVNSAVLWSLGISNAAARWKNKAVGDLMMQKLAARVGSISHSAVNNGMLKKFQKLEEDFHRIYELIKRNDTRRFYF